MLEKLTSAAGFTPIEEVATTGPAAGGEEELADSIREFLDQQRMGWGAKFAAVFEEIVGLSVLWVSFCFELCLV